jgi:hypothetical protein
MPLCDTKLVQDKFTPIREQKQKVHQMDTAHDKTKYSNVVKADRTVWLSIVSFPLTQLFTLNQLSKGSARMKSFWNVRHNCPTIIYTSSKVFNLLITGSTFAFVLNNRIITHLPFSPIFLLYDHKFDNNKVEGKQLTFTLDFATFFITVYWSVILGPPSEINYNLQRL